MLQLLLRAGQSYEDIASLLGVGVDEVRDRARAALTEIAGEDPDREVGLTDYLLGQADPIGRADAVRHCAADPDRQRARLEAGGAAASARPGAQLPDLPEAPGPRRGAVPADGRRRPRPSRERARSGSISRASGG